MKWNESEENVSQTVSVPKKGELNLQWKMVVGLRPPNLEATNLELQQNQFRRQLFLFNLKSCWEAKQTKGLIIISVIRFAKKNKKTTNWILLFEDVSKIFEKWKKKTFR